MVDRDGSRVLEEVVHLGRDGRFIAGDEASVDRKLPQRIKDSSAEFRAVTGNRAVGKRGGILVPYPAPRAFGSVKRDGAVLDDQRTKKILDTAAVVSGLVAGD